MLPLLIDSLDVARRRYRGGPDAVEVIVADNGSTDTTAEIARARGCLVARVERRSIGAARNGGARVASAPVLAFVDADSVVHPETFNAIDEVFARGRVVVGATGVRASRMSPAIGLLVMLTLPLIWLARIDAGVVFCRRKDWAAVGGYDETLLVAEDVRFLLALKRLGRTRGQGFGRARGVKSVTSTRKFDRHGDWRFLAGMLGAPFQKLFNPAGFERWARRYWYEDRG